MSASRHFRVTQTPAETRQEIQEDITAARNAQHKLQDAGQHRLAENMGAAADAYLDELNDLDGGRWAPKHA
ncbi:hypothetical protein [Streptomyces sp. PTD5-9]|uniref:hypothetical protein n=1 Tax=Streptomyces sp. PTD5-9 TaxID=3120150 RepID=UPI00300B9AA2